MRTWAFQPVLSNREYLPQRCAPLLLARAAQPRLEDRHDGLLRSPVDEDDKAKAELLLVFFVERRQAFQDLRRRRVAVVALLRERQRRHLVATFADARMRIDDSDLLCFREFLHDGTGACEYRGTAGERLLRAKPIQQWTRVLEEVQLPR